MVDSLGVPRGVAAVGSGVAIWAVGLLSAAGVGVPGMEQSFFDLFDNLTTKYMLPGGGLLVALIAGWVVPRKDTLAGFEAAWLGALGPAWLFVIRTITPILVVLVILKGLGIFG